MERKPRAPSSCHTGIRLKMLMKAAILAMAPKTGLLVARNSSQAATAEPRPQSGPASPTRESSRAVAGYWLSRTKAPKNGMNMGAVAEMP
jgi:hypothetical protein